MIVFYNDVPDVQRKAMWQVLMTIQKAITQYNWRRRHPPSLWPGWHCRHLWTPI